MITFLLQIGYARESLHFCLAIKLVKSSTSLDVGNCGKHRNVLYFPTASVEPFGSVLQCGSTFLPQFAFEKVI